MTDPNIDDINKRLALHYGQNLFGEQRFRIVWSDEQHEYRVGVFNEFYGSIFLREIRGVQYVPKYPQIKAKWVLEVWLPPTIAYSRELPDSNRGSYEPLYCFQDEHGNALPVSETFAEIVIKGYFNLQLPGDRASDLQEEERKEREAEIDATENELGEAGRSWIGHQLHSGEAIIKP